jgi:hypothetical protein
MHIPCGRRLFTLVAPAIFAPLALLGISMRALHAEAEAPRFTLDPPTVVFINEIHYDNVSTDTNERIEIAAPTGTNVSTAEIVRYNGTGGGAYNTTVTLGGVVGTCGDYDLYVIEFPTNGLQNDNDGVALHNSATNTLVQFLSYEGSFAATDGPANGITSTDIGVQESNNTTPITYSLQLTGNGGVYDDFTWQGPVTNTFGACNVGQTLTQPTTLIELAEFHAQATDQGIALSWTTAVEVDNAGFHLYRGAPTSDPGGDPDDAAPARITARLIGAQAQPGQGASYSFLDPDGQAHALYWLEDVATDGTTSRHGPFAVAETVHAAPAHRLFLPVITPGGQP